MDAGYVDAEQIHHARRDHSITLVGPVGKNTNRQQATGDFFDSTRFTIDWDQRRAVCPGGHTSVQWRDAQSHRGTPVTRVRRRGASVHEPGGHGDAQPCVDRQSQRSSVRDRGADDTAGGIRRLRGPAR
ncbi:hypothetical protein ACWEWX_38475 [Streptomyces asiaticus]